MNNGNKKINHDKWVSVILLMNKLINISGCLLFLVTVEIKTGTRRLMEFLLAPLMRGVSEGARER